MTRYETQAGHRQQLLAVWIAVAFLVSACGGGGDGGASSGLAPQRLAEAPAPSSCNYSPWVQGTIYEAGSIVNYSGNLYIAKMWNAGSLPTPNQYGWSDWSPYDCATGAPAPAPVPAPGSCAAEPWVQGKVYEAGSIVSYQGSLYVAKMWNAGSSPTPNQYGWSDWSPSDCGAPAPAPAPQTCPAAPWVQGKIYEAGSVVNYQGSLYIAKMWNAGSLPTPNANGWSDWSSYDCSTSAPALVVQPASRVNTTTAGEQMFASVSAQADGGYTVAWIDNNMAFAIQRYDSAGGKVGTEVSVPFSRLTTTGVINRTSVAVLRDGSVVFVYETDRRLATGQQVEGIFFQRFDSSGAQLSGETPVVSQIVWGGFAQPGGAGARAVPLTDGGFVVTWVSLSQSPQFLTHTLYKQRYDSQSQPVGGNVEVASYLVQGSVGTFALVADVEGGYTLTLPRIVSTPQIPPFARTIGTSVIHFDAADTAREIVPQRPGSSLLLPLAGNRFVRFTSDSAGTFRQFLDSAGSPVGPATSVASMPNAATELADGSFVVFTQASGGGFTAQRFAANGAALGDAVAVDGNTAAALAGGSLAVAWSATPPGGDLDVFTERVLVRN